jgi:heme-degrading monooxygenase HmoA
MVIVIAKSQLPREKVDAFVEAINQNSPKVKAITGLQKIHFFVDRNTGRAGTVSYWDSEASAKSGGQELQALREQTVGGLGGKVESVEPYEVVLSLVAEAGAAR